MIKQIYKKTTIDITHDSKDTTPRNFLFLPLKYFRFLH